MMWTDENLIAAFREGGIRANLAWRHILENWRSLYRTPILKMGGTVDDSDDAMMDIAEGFQRRVSAPDFTLENKLSTYFVRCVINRWINRAKQDKRDAALFSTENFTESTGQFVANAEADMLSEELRTLMDAVIEEAVGERCKKILGLFALGYSMKEIASAMGYLRPDGAPNDDTAKNEKAGCQKKLRQFFLDHPHVFSQIKSYRT